MTSHATHNRAGEVTVENGIDIYDMKNEAYDQKSADAVAGLICHGGLWQ
jgi:hypothetical protein